MKRGNPEEAIPLGVTVTAEAVTLPAAVEAFMATYGLRSLPELVSFFVTYPTVSAPLFGVPVAQVQDRTRRLALALGDHLPLPFVRALFADPPNHPLGVSKGSRP